VLHTAASMANTSSIIVFTIPLRIKNGTNIESLSPTSVNSTTHTQTRHARHDTTRHDTHDTQQYPSLGI
jgi:hypothetical protein